MYANNAPRTFIALSMAPAGPGEKAATGQRCSEVKGFFVSQHGLIGSSFCRSAGPRSNTLCQAQRRVGALKCNPEIELRITLVLSIYDTIGVPARRPALLEG
jgi:hypothetical protein